MPEYNLVVIGSGPAWQKGAITAAKARVAAGWGLKAASLPLSQYTRLEDIPKDWQEWHPSIRIDVLEKDGFREVRGSDPSSPRAVGVITNHTGFDVEGRRTIDILAKAPGIKLVAIFSPEHGVTGELDVNSVGDSVDRATGVHIYSIYGDTTASRHPPESVLRKLDVLVIDIQDIGSRFYTYESSLGYTLESAAITGTEVVLLDRPTL